MLLGVCTLDEPLCHSAVNTARHTPVIARVPLRCCLRCEAVAPPAKHVEPLRSACLQGVEHILDIHEHGQKVVRSVALDDCCMLACRTEMAPCAVGAIVMLRSFHLRPLKSSGVFVGIAVLDQAAPLGYDIQATCSATNQGCFVSDISVCLCIVQDGSMDVESLERENDRGLDALSERIGLLKQVCMADAGML